MKTQEESAKHLFWVGTYLENALWIQNLLASRTGPTLVPKSSEHCPESSYFYRVSDLNVGLGVLSQDRECYLQMPSVLVALQHGQCYKIALDSMAEIAELRVNIDIKSAWPEGGIKSYFKVLWSVDFALARDGIFKFVPGMSYVRVQSSSIIKAGAALIDLSSSLTVSSTSKVHGGCIESLPSTGVNVESSSVRQRVEWSK
jgi:hypothetical protein